MLSSRHPVVRAGAHYLCFSNYEESRVSGARSDVTGRLWISWEFGGRRPQVSTQERMRVLPSVKLAGPVCPRPSSEQDAADRFGGPIRGAQFYFGPRTGLRRD